MREKIDRRRSFYIQIFVHAIFEKFRQTKSWLQNVFYRKCSLKDRFTKAGMGSVVKLEQFSLGFVREWWSRVWGFWEFVIIHSFTLAKLYKFHDKDKGRVTNSNYSILNLSKMPKFAQKSPNFSSSPKPLPLKKSK